MGFKMEYTLGGRKVSRDQFFDGMVEQARDGAIDELRRRLQRIRCPQHGRTASVSVKSVRGSQFELSIDGCCDALVQRVQAAAGGR